MTSIYRYLPDDYVDAGIAGEARLEITAQMHNYGPESLPSCVILLAKLVFDDGKTLEITKQAQGMFEDAILRDYLRAREKSYEGDEAS